jgi:hypothetical protein
MVDDDPLEERVIEDNPEIEAVADAKVPSAAVLISVTSGLAN